MSWRARLHPALSGCGLGPGRRIVDLSTGRPGQASLRVQVRDDSGARVVGLQHPAPSGVATGETAAPLRTSME